MCGLFDLGGLLLPISEVTKALAGYGTKSIYGERLY